MIDSGCVINLPSLFDRPDHRLGDAERLRKQPWLLVRLDETRCDAEDQPLDAEVLVGTVPVLEDTAMRRAVSEIELDVGVSGIESRGNPYRLDGVSIDIEGVGDIGHHLDEAGEL